MPGKPRRAFSMGCRLTRRVLTSSSASGSNDSSMRINCTPPDQDTRWSAGGHWAMPTHAREGRGSYLSWQPLGQVDGVDGGEAPRVVPHHLLRQLVDRHERLVPHVVLHTHNTAARGHEMMARCQKVKPRIGPSWWLVRGSAVLPLIDAWSLTCTPPNWSKAAMGELEDCEASAASLASSLSR